MKLEYAAALHCIWMERPGALDSLLYVPLKSTGLAPPGNPPPGTCHARPVRNTSSSPETGTVVFQVLVIESKKVEVHVAEGENVILALGTGSE